MSLLSNLWGKREDDEAADTRELAVDWIWVSCSLIAAGLLTASYFLPLWQMELKAPQYPNGLHLQAYGTRMEGDLNEINGLNHYVGVKAIEEDEIVELKLFPLALAGAITTLVVGGLLARGPMRAAVALGVWAFPLGLLADLQFWLYRYGHDLNPRAALRFEEFTPKVIGSTQVMNFHTENTVAVGFWMMVGAALAVTVGPPLLRFLRDSWNNTGQQIATAGLVMCAGAGSMLWPQEGAEAADPAWLSERIARAEPGEVINVVAGTYRGPLRIDKTLTLVGDGMPIISGDGRGDVIVISAAGVTIRGFVIEQSGREVSLEPAGVRVTADNATIEGNEIRDVLYGIALQNSDGHIVRGNSLSSFEEYDSDRRGHGIYLWETEQNLITDNIVRKVKDGIFLGFASDNVIDGNEVSDSRYGIHYMSATNNTVSDNQFRSNVAGAIVMYSSGVEMTGNEFEGHRSAASGFAVLLKDVDSIVMTDNLIHDNRLGMTIEGTPNTPGSQAVVRRNLIAYNDTAIELATTTSVTFTENSFIGNDYAVETRGGSLEHRNEWSLDGRGNYWDIYRGYDANGDGIADLPFRYEGAYDELVRNNAALKAYAFTPARTALDLAASWFPAFRPDPTVVDRHPLMSPAIEMPSAGKARIEDSLLLSAGLLLAPLLVLAIAGGAYRRRWAAC
ncbi:MAG: nitrous oxide reductase family maturation protein NosD [Dehalococcoidia bacterium]